MTALPDLPQNAHMIGADHYIAWKDKSFIKLWRMVCTWLDIGCNYIGCNYIGRDDDCHM